MRPASALTALPALFVGLLGASFPQMAGAWPYDGYAETGIRRLEYTRLALEGEIDGSLPPAGALHPAHDIDLRLVGQDDAPLPVPDPGLSEQLRELLGEHAGDYGISLLDLSVPGSPVYAAWRDDYQQNVGSVGKLVVAVGFFQALADAWPDDTAMREQVLRNTIVTADDFSQSDHHTVKFFDLDTRELTRRPIKIGDQGRLWEFLDWMLSVSSNSAAAMVMRESMLLRGNGKAYPLPEEAIRPWFDDLGSSGRTTMFQSTFWAPMTGNGLDLGEIRQGSFFTRGGKARVNGGGNSYATSGSLAELVLKMERGTLVDEWSSRQLKRLVYLTERRIRYASSPALTDAAVYFKSGSLYSCREEEGFHCGKYKGNVINYMNSVAIIEEGEGDARLHYVVTLISNVLRENSAVAHQTLGTKIHRLMQSRQPSGVAGDSAVVASE